MSIISYRTFAIFLRMDTAEAESRRACLERALEMAEIAMAAATDSLDIIEHEGMIALDISLHTVDGRIPFQGGHVRRIARLSMGGRPVALDELASSTWLMRARRGIRLLQWKHGYMHEDELPARTAARLLYTAQDLYRYECGPARRRGSRHAPATVYPLTFPNQQPGSEKIESQERVKHLARGTAGDAFDEVPEGRRPVIAVVEVASPEPEPVEVIR